MAEKKIKLYRITRGTIAEKALYDIGEVELRKTANGFRTRANTRVKGLDDPYIEIKLKVFSESKDTRKMDRLCEKIRKALAEYNEDVEQCPNTARRGRTAPRNVPRDKIPAGEGKEAPRAKIEPKTGEK